MQVQFKLKTEIGNIYLAADEIGLTSLSSMKLDVPLVKAPEGILKQAVKELEEYFLGKRKTFSVPLNPKGTEFQMKVWKELGQIPYGETISYEELAKRIKNPKAVRAVGAANGKNPLWLIVPCHRVIGKNGSLTGYAGGLSVKKKLLSLELRF
jgi:methylated-DNA-[protein]-cysteine S-methyltransferase